MVADGLSDFLIAISATVVVDANVLLITVLVLLVLLAKYVSDSPILAVRLG